MISDTTIIYPGVKLGMNVIIEDFCIIGAPPRGTKPGEMETILGDDAVIRSHTVIYAGNRNGNKFQAGNKVNIRELNEIGDNVSIGTLSVVEHHVKIADRVRIHTQVFVPEYCVLEEGCWIGPNAVLTNAKYPNQPDTKDHLEGVTVRRGAVVGANATILPGVSLGEGCMVGAGAVVCADVEVGVIVAGNPAKMIRRR